MPEFMIILDALASLSSLIAAWHASSHSRSTWLWSVAAASINFVLYCKAGVYGHAALDLWYIAVAILGLGLWKNQHVNRLTLKQKIMLGFIILFTSYVLEFVLIKVNSQAARWDSLSFVTGITAQLCMAFQLIDHWWLWLIHDGMNLIVLSQVKLPFQIVKQTIYLLIAVRGYYRWLAINKAADHH